MKAAALALAFTVFLLCFVVPSDCQATSECCVGDNNPKHAIMDAADDQWSIPIIEVSGPEAFDPGRLLLDGDHKTENSKLNIVTVPLEDLQSAATEYDKHKGHKEGDHATKGHKGKKGFHADEGHKKKHYEDHGKNHKSGHHKKGGKHYKGHDHHKKHHDDWHKGKKGKKGHHHHVKGHHKKGHKDKGFKNVYHKEEYGHNKKFYDDSDFKKHHKKYDDIDLHFKGHKGDHHKSGQYKGEKHHDKSSKKGDFHKGSKHNDDHGHKNKYGHKKHYDEHHKHAHKKGSDKKYGHKHGSKHGHHDHHGHYSQHLPLYQTAFTHDQPAVYVGKDNEYDSSYDREEFQGHYSAPVYNADNHAYSHDNEGVRHHKYNSDLSESQIPEIYAAPDEVGTVYCDEPSKEEAANEPLSANAHDVPTEQVIDYEFPYVAIDESKTDYHITTRYPDVHTEPDDALKSRSSPIRGSKELVKIFLKPFELMPPFADSSFQRPTKGLRKYSTSQSAPFQQPKQRFSPYYLIPPPPPPNFS